LRDRDLVQGHASDSCQAAPRRKVKCADHARIVFDSANFGAYAASLLRDRLSPGRIIGAFVFAVSVHEQRIERQRTTPRIKRTLRTAELHVQFAARRLLCAVHDSSFKQQEADVFERFWRRAFRKRASAWRV
jgi:hypothetical protein